jgi:hypothetical protein
MILSGKNPQSYNPQQRGQNRNREWLLKKVIAFENNYQTISG